MQITSRVSNPDMQLIINGNQLAEPNVRIPKAFYIYALFQETTSPEIPKLL